MSAKPDREWGDLNPGPFSEAFGALDQTKDAG